MSYRDLSHKHLFFRYDFDSKLFSQKFTTYESAQTTFLSQRHRSRQSDLRHIPPFVGFSICVPPDTKACPSCWTEFSRLLASVLPDEAAQALVLEYIFVNGLDLQKFTWYTFCENGRWIFVACPVYQCRQCETVTKIYISLFSFRFLLTVPPPAYSPHPFLFC